MRLCRSMTAEPAQLCTSAFVFFNPQPSDRVQCLNGTVRACSTVKGGQAASGEQLHNQELCHRLACRRMGAFRTNTARARLCTCCRTAGVITNRLPCPAGHPVKHGFA